MTDVPDLGELRAELRAAGLFEPREAAGWTKIAILATGLTAALVGIAHAPWWGIIPLVVAAAVCSTSLAMVGHEGSHKAFSKSPARNTLVQYGVFPLFSGLSALYWREKHDRKHHGHPNVPGEDPDLRPWPFVSCKEDMAEVPGWRRWIIRTFQSWGIWLWTPLMALGMRRASMWHLAAHAREHGIDRHWVLDVACLVAHYFLWMGLPWILWGPLVGIGVYSLVWACVGVMLILVFMPAHIGLPITMHPRKDWVHQLETTRDLQLPRAVSWFFIGLDYQVEHHLFPKISHTAMPQAAAITARWCRERGLPYKSVPYLYGLADANRFMHRMWKMSANTPAPTAPSVVVDPELGAPA